MSSRRPLSRNCPFVLQPMAGCRVNVVTSQTIPKILECCGDRFRECPLYRKRLADGDGAGADVINAARRFEVFGQK